MVCGRSRAGSTSSGGEAEGYAVILTIPPNVRHADRLLGTQQAARESGAGLWRGCADGPQEATDDAPVAADRPPAAPHQPAPKPEAEPVGNCHPSYPDVCVPPSPPDLDCGSPELAGRTTFTVLPPDPQRFDADKDGIGCEPRR